MLFRSRKPAPPLSNFIENLWLYDGYDSPHFKERIFPSGTFELVFNLRSDELRIYKATQPDQYERFSGAIVSGPYNGFFVTDAAEEVSVMGVHFKPGGAFPFLGPPAHELADSHIDLEAIWGRTASSICRACISNSITCHCPDSFNLFQYNLQPSPLTSNQEEEAYESEDPDIADPFLKCLSVRGPRAIQGAKRHDHSESAIHGERTRSSGRVLHKISRFSGKAAGAAQFCNAVPG
jgi:hypothetical protein